MAAEPTILDVQVTDAFGNAKVVTWVAQLEGGQVAKLSLGDGLVARTDAAELCEAFDPRREVRAA